MAYLSARPASNDTELVSVKFLAVRVYVKKRLGGWGGRERNQVLKFLIVLSYFACFLKRI